MAPARSASWAYFNATSLRYGNIPSRIVFASCKFCQPVLSAEHQALLQQNASTSVNERKVVASTVGLVPGQKETMARHLLLCGKAPADVKLFAATSLNDSRQQRSSTRSKAVRAIKREAPDNAEAQAGPVSAAAGCSVTPRLKQARVDEYLPECRCATPGAYDSRKHERLLVNLASTFPGVSFEMFQSDEFRALQAFYCHGLEQARRGNLFVTADRMRAVIPGMCDTDLEQARHDLEFSAMSTCGYTLVSGKQVRGHMRSYRAYEAARPGSAPTQIALMPLPSEEQFSAAIAAEWEEMIGLAANVRHAEKQEGFFLSIDRAVDAVMSDTSYSNKDARNILGVRHPDVIMLPCFAQLLALDCVDLQLFTNSARVLPACVHLVSTFNASTDIWLPRLNAAMVKALPQNRAFSLKNSVITRWTGVWMSACSVLNAKPAFELLLSSNSGLAGSLFLSSDPRLTPLKRCFQTIANSTFWSQLEEYLVLAAPAVESSLVLRSGDATLGDVLYCKCRQYQRFYEAKEARALEALEDSWLPLEQPLVLIAFSFDPRYRKYAVQMGLDVSDLGRHVSGYADRWGARGICGLDASLSLSFNTVIVEWFSGLSPWEQDCERFSHRPGRFWLQVSRKFASRRNEGSAAGALLLCEVLRKVYSCSTNVADPELVFAELGRANPSLETPHEDKTIVMKAAIASSTRMRKYDEKKRGALGCSGNLHKQFVETDAVLRRLRSVDSGMFRSIESDVIGGRDHFEAVDNLDASGNTLHSSRVGLRCGLDEAGDPQPILDVNGGSVEPASSEEIAVTEDCFRSADELRARFNSMDAELRGVGNSGVVDHEAGMSEPEAAKRARSLEHHAIGNIPRSRHGDGAADYLPRDNLSGFRGFKISLGSLVNGVTLPSIASIDGFFRKPQREADRAS